MSKAGGSKQTHMLHVDPLPCTDGAIALEGLVLVFETKEVLEATAAEVPYRQLWQPAQREQGAWANTVGTWRAFIHRSACQRMNWTMAAFSEGKVPDYCQQSPRTRCADL